MDKNAKPPLKIITYGHPTLRVVCDRVTEFDDALRSFADDLYETMLIADGVGLAASQVNVRKQIFVVGVPQENSDEPVRMDVVNPLIVEKRGSWDYEEGCLSIPDIREVVTRPKWIKVKYQDLDGKHREIELDGLMARVFQHEIDHLNGVMFVDHLTPVRRALLNGKLKQMARDSLRESA